MEEERMKTVMTGSEAQESVALGTQCGSHIDGEREVKSIDESSGKRKQNKMSGKLYILETERNVWGEGSG